MWVALGEPGKTSIKRLKINKRKCTNTSRHTEIRDKTIKTREHKFPAIKNSMFAIFSCIHLFVHTTCIEIHVYIGINIYAYFLGFLLHLHTIFMAFVLYSVIIFSPRFSLRFIDIINYG